MKHLRLALLVFTTALCVARAQEGGGSPPTEIPDFSNLDEYIYEPKFNMTFGFRALSGAKTSFSGKSTIQSKETLLDGVNTYHDGSIGLDTRTATVTNDDGSTSSTPITPDGKTNTWGYTSDTQVLTGAYAGLIGMHRYSANIVDPSVRHKDIGRTFGMELGMSHDMGKLFGRIAWMIGGGMSINDIKAAVSDSVKADITTKTDYYSTFGVKPGAARFSSPSMGSTTIANGDGTFSTVTTDNTVLIGSKPVTSTEATEKDNTTSIRSNWRLKGAFYTFRAGPTFFLPVTSRLRLSLGFGAAFAYSGTTYTVVNTFTPATGADITDTFDNLDAKLLPGFYAEANIQFDLTDRTGFYLGALYQNVGSYTQNLDVKDTVNALEASYSTRVDLSRMQGLRAGMTYKF